VKLTTNLSFTLFHPHAFFPVINDNTTGITHILRTGLGILDYNASRSHQGLISQADTVQDGGPSQK